MNTKTVQKWCETNTEYFEAKALQQKNEELDPKHETLPRIIVIDCRTKY